MCYFLGERSMSKKTNLSELSAVDFSELMRQSEKCVEIMTLWWQASIDNVRLHTLLS